MRLLSLFIVFAMITFLHADTIVAKVIDLHGIVKVAKIGSIQKRLVQVDQEIFADELITSSSDSWLVLKLADASDLVLDEKSTLSFHSQKDLEQHSGRVYYKISSRQAKNALRVTTPFSIIGIKGTEFIVDFDQDNKSIKLKDGVLGIQSVKEDFELYRKKVQEEYEKFLSSQEDAFAEFKDKQVQGFAQKTKEFDLYKQQSLSFDGNSVYEKGWSAQDDADFAQFENMIR